MGPTDIILINYNYTPRADPRRVRPRDSIKTEAGMDVRYCVTSVNIIVFGLTTSKRLIQTEPYNVIYDINTRDG